MGSWEGDAITNDYNTTFDFPSTLDAGSEHVLTILQDHMGYEGDWTVASDWFKRPRGILDFYFTGSGNTTVDTWKLTGNLGGEDVSLVIQCLDMFRRLNISSLVY